VGYRLPAPRAPWRVRRSQNSAEFWVTVLKKEEHSVWSRSPEFSTLVRGKLDVDYSLQSQADSLTITVGESLIKFLYQLEVSYDNNQEC
jgi:hypothetical protein